MEKELGSKKEFTVNEDGSISYYSDQVSDQVRAQAEAERDRLLAAREKAAATPREVGTPKVEDLGVTVAGARLKDLIKQVSK